MFLGPIRAFGCSAALHLLLAGIFTFMLARALGAGKFGALTAGIVFTFSGFMVVWLELPTLVNVATWLPLALYLILKSSDNLDVVGTVFAGLALGFAVLAGHFQIASYVVGTAFLWWIWLIVSKAREEGLSQQWKRVFLAVLSFGVLFLIAAPQVLPTLELAGMSHRTRAVTADGYSRYVSNGIPARNLITAFLPNFYGNPSTPEPGYWAGGADLFMERTFYIGVLPLLLVIIGAVFAFRKRGVAFFVVLGALALLFAFGTVINAVPYYLLPGSSALGGPNRVVLLFCFAAAMLVGFGAEWFLQRAREECSGIGRKHGWKALLIGSGIFIAALVASQVIATSSIQSTFGIDAGNVLAVNGGQYLTLITTLIAGVAVLALYTHGFIPRTFFVGLTLAVVVSDLFAFGMGFNPTASVDQVYPRTEVINWIEKNAPDTRLMPINDSWDLYNRPDVVLPPNAATVFGFYDMQGYDSLFPKHYKEFVDQKLGVDSSPQENGNMLFIKKYYSEWPLGTAGVVLTKEPITGKGLASAYSADGVNIYSYGYYESAYVLPPAGTVSRPSARAWITDRDTNDVTVNTDTDNTARLVLAEAYYPGWQAVVNGNTQPVNVAQDVFRSVTIQPGSSVVKFSYLPGTFVVGAFAGLLGAIVVGCAIGIRVSRKREE